MTERRWTARDRADDRFARARTRTTEFVDSRSRRGRVTRATSRLVVDDETRADRDKEELRVPQPTSQDSWIMTSRDR